MPDVFISYSRRDKEFVERLNQALEAHGKDAWVDWQDIPASAEWLREIQDGIDSSDAFLFVLSPDSVASQVCAQELDHALERRKRILPIVHRDVDPAAVRAEAAAINWVYLRDQDSFEQGLQTLVKALETDLDHVRAHTRLASQAINWERSGHDRARLLRGSELQDAERWLTEAAAKQPGPTELQAQFVQASREAALRRGRMLFGGVAFALVVAIALAIVALIQRSNAIHQSQVAYSRQLDAEAQNKYSSDPELSVLLAIQAARVAPGPATREALRQALGQSHVRERYTDPKGPIGDAMWSPDGSRLLIAEENLNQAEIVRPASGGKPIVLHAPGLDSQIGWDGSGRLAITGAAEPSIWNGKTGQLVRHLPTRAVDAALSPDGTRAATVDVHGTLHIWNVATGAQLAQRAPATVGVPGCLHWSPDGSVLAECNVGASTKAIGAKASVPETLTLFSASGRRLWAIHQPNLIFDVAFSPDSRRVALAVAADRAGPGTLVYDVRTRSRLLAIPTTSTAVAFSPDGKELAYALLLGDIAKVHTFASHKPDLPLVGSTATINSIAFSHTGTYVVTSSGDGTARVFDSFFGTQLEVLYGHTQSVTDATFGADDTQLATASKDGTARVWTTPVPHALARREVAKEQQYVALSPDGRTGLVAGPASGTALVVDSRTLAGRATLAAPRGQVFAGGAFSPDGRWIGLLSGHPAGSNATAPQALELYDARTDKLSATIAPPGAQVQDGVFDRHGNIATLSSTGEVDLWSAETGHRERMLLPAGRPAETLSMSSDGGRLAVSHPDGSIDLLNTAGGKIRTLRGPAPQAIVPGVPTSTILIRTAFSPDGRWLVSIGDHDQVANHDVVRVWDLATGRQVRTLPAGQTPLVSLAFSQDGSMLAAGDAATAYLWRFPSGVALQPLNHANPATWGEASELNPIGGVRVSFSRDGSTLTTQGDLVVRDWNAQTGESLLNVPFALRGAATPDAQRVVSVSSGLLGVFRCDLCGGLTQLMANARRDVTRQLTPGERALYLRQG